MGFSITSGPPGILGATFIVILIATALIVAYVFFGTVREAHDDVVEENDHDIDA